MNSQISVWNKSYQNNLIWSRDTKTLSKILKNKSILELGVGTGKTLRAILKQKPLSVTALDFSESAIDRCKSEFSDKSVSFITQDFLKFKTEKKFDIIICYYFLNNLSEKERAIAVKHMHSLLNKNGIILFEDFALGDFRQEGQEVERNTIRNKSGIVCHFFSKDEIKELFSDFSLKNLKLTSLSPIKSNTKAKRNIISFQAIINNNI